mmetsp:Transcript_2035/g.4654  ORF Transcript_2035/g.4654 Transcript_2035/m.4654 type:complete len:498 (+) Transcript_2035:2152-3645(+)
MATSIPIIVTATFGLIEVIDRLCRRRCLRKEEEEVVNDLKMRLIRLQSLTELMQASSIVGSEELFQDVQNNIESLSKVLKSDVIDIRPLARLSTKLNDSLTDLSTAMAFRFAKATTAMMKSPIPDNILNQLTFHDAAQFFEEHFISKGVAIEFPTFMSCLEYYMFSKKRPFKPQYRQWAVWILQPNEDHFIKFSEFNSLMIVLDFGTRLFQSNFDLEFEISVSKSGDKYIGELQDGQRNGYGVLIKTDRSVFMGNWSRGLKQYRGSTRYASGLLVEAEYEEDVVKGHVKALYPDGSIYTGEFSDGSKNGFGTVRWLDGTSYEGHWLNDRHHGPGEMKSSCGTMSFKGNWLNGLKEGLGSTYLKDGISMECEYLRGEPQWPFTYMKPGEWMYIGDLVEGLRQGPGECLWENGTSYKGLWHEDKRQGHGKFIDSDGTVYDGDWDNDMKCGQGILETETIVLVGNWVQNSMIGRGEKHVKGEAPKVIALKNGGPSSCQMF